MKACYIDLRYYAYFVPEKESKEIARQLFENMKMILEMEKALENDF